MIKVQSFAHIIYSLTLMLTGAKEQAVRPSLECLLIFGSSLGGIKPLVTLIPNVALRIYAVIVIRCAKVELIVDNF